MGLSMTSLPFCRAAFRRNALPLGIGLTSGLVLLHRQPPMRFDALSNSHIATSRRPFSESPGPRQRKDRLNPEVIKQLSSGSLTGMHYFPFSRRHITPVTHFCEGFITGLVVSVFSKTLVLLIGLGIIFIQVLLPEGLALIPRSNQLD